MVDNEKNGSNKLLYAVLGLASIGTVSGGVGIGRSSSVEARLGERLTAIETKLDLQFADDHWDLDQDEDIAELKAKDVKHWKLHTWTADLINELRFKHELELAKRPNLGD